MKKWSRWVAIGVFWVMFVPALTQAQVSLLSPEDGAELTAPPTFSWESEYMFVVFVSIFSYGPGAIYHPFFFAVPFQDTITMPDRWWDRLTYDVPQIWLVVGFEGPRKPVWSEVKNLLFPLTPFALS